ncbi:MAG: 7-carboxy-7-deazaguanine synthase QueE [Rickettsiales bacterium]|jgi:7-carboxy-7-deazaguanine synthase|nr:7-carboxy-7-deazaguanine synthase QueE [Rickettsiales bacterium]
MFGKNKPLTMVQTYDHNLDIVNIFSTIQGEGPYAGVPAIFIRLGGCNLKCNFCDTEFDNFTKTKIDDILKEVSLLAGNITKLIIITGGEPLRQDITELCELLITQKFDVQIETNGTIYRNLNKAVTIITSPKNHNGNGYNHINNSIKQRTDYFKFIISENNKDYNFIPSEFLSYKNIYVQPMDEYDDTKNIANQKLCTKLALKYNFKISIQLHKILNIA